MDAPLEVQALVVTHRHGEDLTLHATVEGAMENLREYVGTWWSEAVGRSVGSSDPLPEDMPDDLHEAIEAYFSAMEDDEGWSLSSLTVGP